MSVPATQVTPGQFAGGPVQGSPGDDFSYQIDRIANYPNTGQEPGTTAAALGVRTTVHDSGVCYEWALRCEVHNYDVSNETQHCGGYAAGRRYDGAGQTWAFATDVIDYMVNPTTRATVCEDAMMAKGGDNNHNRVITGIYGKRLPVDRGGDTNTAVITYGVLEAVEPGAHVRAGYHQIGSYDRGFDIHGNYVDSGISFVGGSFGGNAIDMDANQRIGLGHGMSIRYGANGRIEFLQGNTVRAWIDMTINNDQLT